MIIHIRDMKSHRCKAMVTNELRKLGLHYKIVELGEVELKGNISVETLQLVDIALKDIGLELIYDKKSLLIERISTSIHQLVYLSDDLPKTNFSEFISNAFHRDYTYLSNLFSEIKGISIQNYIIAQKIERVKELLVYDELSLSDIAFKLKYSSVAHLSNQFKKVTGQTPSSFKQSWYAPDNSAGTDTPQSSPGN